MAVKGRRQRVLAAIAVVLLVAFGAFSETLSIGQWIYDNCPKIFIWNKTHSVASGLYMYVPLGTLSKGDYVLFYGTDDIRSIAVEREWIEEDTRFMKKIGALPGDSFKVDDRTKMFYINDSYIGMVSDKDSKGRELPHRVHGIQSVPEGFFLPVGESPRSYDGRYYGTQPISSIKYKVIPIFTFK